MSKLKESSSPGENLSQAVKKMIGRIRPNRFAAVVLLLLILAGLLWVNLQFSNRNPGGNDFLVHYLGTRSLLLEGISPYSDQVAERIQVAAYGHPATGEEHELRVAYPLYSIFLFAPFSLIGDYQVARAIWMTFLEIALVWMALECFRLFDWRPSLRAQAIILLFSLLWYHAVRSVINGNAVVLIALAITIAFRMIKDSQDEGAGFLLAATTIKPHLVVLLIPLVLIWASNRRRWKLVAWFGGTLAALVLSAMLFIPNWMLQNLWEILRYPGYNPAGTLAQAVGDWLPGIERQLSWALALVLGAVLAGQWNQARKGGVRHLVWTGLFTLAASQWIGIQTDPGNFILLYPALILILAEIDRRIQVNDLYLTGIPLGVMLIGLWALFLATIDRSYQPVQGSAMFLPLPAVCLAGLAWIKNWVIKPHLNPGRQS